MTTTNNLLITLVEQAQAQKEVTINTAISRMDAILNTGAIDKDLATPPGSPVAGDVYIVAASPTGAWSGKAGQVAYYDQTWQFIVPKEGMSLWVKDEDTVYSYDGSAWVASSGAKISLKTGSTPTSASSPGGFSATHYIQIDCNGTTYYLPLKASSW